MTRTHYDVKPAIIESQIAAVLPPAASARGVSISRMSAEHKDHLIRILPRESHLRRALLRDRWQGR